MTPLQEIEITMANGDSALTPIVQVAGGFRAEIGYRCHDLGLPFDHHEGPIHTTPDVAFDWMVGTVQGIATVRSSTIDTIDNPCNEEFLSAVAERIILTSRGISAAVTVNGA